MSKQEIPDPGGFDCNLFPEFLVQHGVAEFIGPVVGADVVRLAFQRDPHALSVVDRNLNETTISEPVGCLLNGRETIDQGVEIDPNEGRAFLAHHHNTFQEGTELNDWPDKLFHGGGHFQPHVFFIRADQFDRFLVHIDLHQRITFEAVAHVECVTFAGFMVEQRGTDDIPSAR